MVLNDLVVRFLAQTHGFNKPVLRMGNTLSTFSERVHVVNTRVNRFGGLLGKATAAAKTLARALTVGVIAAVTGGMRSAELFEQSMRGSLAIMGDVSAMMKGEMKRAAFDVASATKFAAKETAEAFYFLASAGLKAKQAIAALPQVARFAQAGNFDLAVATELASGAQAAMGLKSQNATKNLENLTRVTDVLVKANELAQSSTEQFATALTNDAANAGRMAGQSIEQIVAVLAAFAEKNVVGEQAGTAYARAINYLSIQAVENAAAFKRAGVAMFDHADKTRTLVDVIADLEKRFAGMSDKQRTVELMTLGFTKKTIALMNTLIGTSDRIREFTRALEEAGGTTKRVADNQLTPFQKGWASISSATTEVAGKLWGVLGPALGFIMNMVGKVGTAFAYVFSFTFVRKTLESVGLMNREIEETAEKTQAASKETNAMADAAQRASGRMTQLASANADAAKSYEALHDIIASMRTQRFQWSVGSGLGSPDLQSSRDYQAQVDSLQGALQSINPKGPSGGKYVNALRAMVSETGSARGALEVFQKAMEDVKTPRETLDSARRMIELMKRVGLPADKAATAWEQAKERFKKASDEIADALKLPFTTELNEARQRVLDLGDKLNGLSDVDIKVAAFRRMEGVTAAHAREFAKLSKQAEKFKGILDDEKRDKKLAAQWKSRIETPIEAMRRKTAEIEGLFQKELLTEAQADRAIAGLDKKKRPKEPDLAAKRKGSAEAFHTIMQSMGIAGGKKEDKVEKKLSETNRILGEIRDKETGETDMDIDRM